MLANPRTQAHIQLMTRMARVVGADLDHLGDAEWSVALERCCACANPGSCEDWLDDNSDGAPQPPRFCPNRKLMTAAAG
ncbi:hypothetical protein SAMN05421774_102662 [Gemmobacter megaterium]|uniref:DUF6455 domain-containing protein n=1 Tax=Gemmobacter megaterium TaxID=1086013 RepID=A0A1N7MG59_9RHOB|nr:DUF6455 family protein [Gemmobacter megaterium]GGE06955.1 hypothetical protein GCM10011345_10750 [Gemmobacter megaterium]SIS85038.1 hypothetical protein SAMN05421774_102662 [Gemmobacter megaterium]